MPVLYAETHYRLRLLFSYLFKKEPEIIADVPHRVGPEMNLPILIIIKDADKYPVTITRINIFLDKNLIISSISPTKVNCAYQEELFEVESADIDEGLHEIDVQFEYICAGKTITCYNDNYRTTAKAPFPVYFAKQKWPTPDEFISGEVHAHTSYTSDQIEFAASPASTARMGQAMGMQFFCATDHSYDLDDFSDDYSKNDPDLGKWSNYLQTLARYNLETKSFCIVPGEEISVRNHQGKNIHLLVYNPVRFFKGSGDSGDRVLRTRSEHSVEDVIRELGDNSIAIAAHPVDQVPLLQKIVLNRSEWKQADVLENDIQIIQMINSNTENHISEAIAFWRSLLLKGKYVLGMAGNDAHGNFARYRQIKTPFLMMKESYNQLFGFWRTVVHHPKPDLSVDSIIQAFKSHDFYFSNGPGIYFQAHENGIIHPMGSRIGLAESVDFSAFSNKEFGKLQSMQVYQGIIGTNEELLLFEEKVFKDSYNSNNVVNTFDKDKKSYLRAEVISESDRGIFRAFSNPIWISGRK